MGAGHWRPGVFGNGHGRAAQSFDDYCPNADTLKRLQAETAAGLDVLLPAVLDRAIKGEL